MIINHQGAQFQPVITKLLAGWTGKEQEAERERSSSEFWSLEELHLELVIHVVGAKAFEIAERERERITRRKSQGVDRVQVYQYVRGVAGR